jgi:Pyruvate/2-oxoacid:ferredoxin oxidoreductase delta subunit
MTAVTRSVRNVEIVWSSGTGNSRRAALWFEVIARVRDCVVGLRDVHEPPPEPRDLDLLVLVYPTHGFTAPWSLFRYLFQLPKGSGAKISLIATRGGGWYLFGPLPGFAGTATWLPALILLLKGYKIRGLTGLDLPSNWNALHPGMNALHAQFFLRRARVKVRRFASRMIEGRTWIATPCNAIELLVGLALLPVSVLYLFMGKFFLSQLFFADPNCDECGICMKACPERAIRTVKGHPRWTLQCESCHRCMAVCPKQAVQAHHGLAALGVWLAGLAAIPLATFHLPVFLRTLLEWAALAGLFFLLQHIVARLRGRSLAIVSLSSLTRWYRRYREPRTHLRDLRPK